MWNSFLLYLLVKILQLVHEISSLPEVLCKKDVLKNFTNENMQITLEAVIRRSSVKRYS